MSIWSRDEFLRLWNSYAGDADPDDPKERKRLRLVRVATELFIKQGYRKTSMDEVAAAAGIAKGTLYLYFKNKGELMLHAIIEEKRRYLATMLPIITTPMAPAERLLAWIRAGLVLNTQSPLLSRLLSRDQEILSALHDLPADVMERSEQDRHAIMGQLVREVAAPHPLTQDEVTAYVQVLTGVLYLGGHLSEAHVLQGLSVDRFAEILSSLLVAGLQKKGSVS